MESNITWRMLVAVAVVYCGTLVFYRLFLHPLARFPGPRLAAISRWYEGYYDVVLGGQYTSKIAKLHRIYGPIIRISPYELHIIDPAFFETLYRMDGRWDKYAWTYDAFGAKGSTVFCSDHDTHKARRRAIAPFFSKPNVAARQDLVRRNIDKLCRRLSQVAGTRATVNLGAAISAFARDNADEYILGKACSELDADDFGIELSTASQGGGLFWRTTKHVRWFGPAMRAMPVGWAMRVGDEGTRAFLGYLQKSALNTCEALAAATSSPPDDEEEVQETMVHAIVRSNLQRAEKAPGRVLAEVGTVTSAGSETTGNVLRLVLYHVYANAEILRRLRREIAASAAVADPTEATIVPLLKRLEQLPYLTAVVTEGMRLSPALATRAARITDKDLFYGAWRIPAGTPVGMTTLLMHTDERLYPDPMRFDPDRWMDPTAARGAVVADRVFAPFSRGTRICLGMHLAWAEMYLLVAALVQRFDFTIEGATAADFELERDDFAIGTKAGCNLVARVTLREG